MTGSRRSAALLRRTIESGERLVLMTLVLYEWQRGPRRPEELAAQEALWPSHAAIAFGAEEAATAAALYRSVRAPRGREMELAIAACAIRWRATLWTLNTRDYRDVPGLHLLVPE